MRLRILAVTGIFLLAAPLLADNVYLKNGQVYSNCKARYLADGSVEIQMKGGTIVMPAEKVAYIEYEDVPVEQEEEAGGPVLSPILERLLGAAAEKEGEEGKKKPKGSELQLRVKTAVELMASENILDRSEGEAILSGLGREALRFSLSYLYDDNANVRLGVSKVIASLSPKEATKVLVEALYAATPERAEPPPYMTAYLRNIRDALRGATGENFGYSPHSANQERAVKKWLEWYEKNMLKLPQQVNEPELDPKDPKYEETLKKLRKLDLQRRRLKPPTYSKLPTVELEVPVTEEELPPAEGILPVEEM